MRDILDYTLKYLEDDFEPVKVKYRRKRILMELKKYNLGRMLEVGCGDEPLFEYLRDDKYETFDIVEPGTEFVNIAKHKAESHKNVSIIQAFFNMEYAKSKCSNRYDFIVCSELLHEVEDDKDLVLAVKESLKQNGYAIFEVPNAGSLHRLLGRNMGMLESVHSVSERGIKYQINRVYDMNSLKSLVEQMGLSVVSEGGIFLKPFSHSQMKRCLDFDIIDDRVLDGLDELGAVMPDIASEIYVVCQKI